MTAEGRRWWSAALARLDRWLFISAPPERLAVFRILVGVFAVAYLAVRLPAFLSTTRRVEGFEPVGVLWFLTGRPAPAAVVAVIWLTLGLGVLFTLGFWFRAIGPAFALGLLMITTYRSSWGRLLYFENLLVLHVAILAVARSADAYHIGGARRRPGRWPTDVAYGWPLRLCALVTVTTYVLAGVAKLRIGGAAWLDGTSLRNHIAYSAARLEVLGGNASPLAAPLTRHPWLFSPMAVVALTLELAAPLALIRPLRSLWVGGIWALHVAIAASMFVVFPYPLVLVAFAPLYRLERLDPLAVMRDRRGRGLWW